MTSERTPDDDGAPRQSTGPSRRGLLETDERSPGDFETLTSMKVPDGTFALSSLYPDFKGPLDAIVSANYVVKDGGTLSDDQTRRIGDVLNDASEFFAGPASFSPSHFEGRFKRKHRLDPDRICAVNGRPSFEGDRVFDRLRAVLLETRGGGSVLTVLLSDDGSSWAHRHVFYSEST